MALPAGEPVPALPHHGVQPVRKRPDHVLKPCLAQHIPHVLLGGIGTGQPQVRGDGFVEKVPVLGHHAEGGAHRVEGQVADVQPCCGTAAAEAHGPGIDVVKPREKLRDG